MANIKNDPAYDPFPREGLVRQFKPAILAELGKFLKKYPLVDRQDALFTFVNLACDAEKRFDPARGFSFWTYCQHYLKGAIRILITKVIAADKLLIHEPIVPYDDWKRSTLEAEGNGNEEFVPRSQQFGSPAEEKAALLIQKEMRAREVEHRFRDEHLDTIPADYGKGGNGARVALDLNGLIVGASLYDKSEAHARGVIDRLSGDVRVIQQAEPADSPRLLGRMRAVVAHSERLAREADQEAENQRGGDFSPVFLEARDTLIPGLKIRERKAVSPRSPRTSEGTCLTRLNPIIRETPYAERIALLVGAAEALRPDLSDKETGVLDWLLEPRERTLTALAKEIDITKGYASKLRGRLLNLLGKRMTAPESPKLIERGCELLNDPELKARIELAHKSWTED